MTASGFFFVSLLGIGLCRKFGDKCTGWVGFILAFLAFGSLGPISGASIVVGFCFYLFTMAAIGFAYREDRNWFFVLVSAVGLTFFFHVFTEAGPYARMDWQ